MIQDYAYSRALSRKVGRQPLLLLLLIFQLLYLMVLMLFLMPLLPRPPAHSDRCCLHFHAQSRPQRKAQRTIAQEKEVHVYFLHRTWHGAKDQPESRFAR